MFKIRSLVLIGLTSCSISTMANALWVPYVYFTPETQMAGGILGIHRFGKVVEKRSSSLRHFITYTQNKQTILNVSPRIYLNDNKNRIDITLAHQQYPKYFYGVGNSTNREKRILYNELNNQLSTQFTRKFYLNYHFVIGAESINSKIQKINIEHPKLASIVAARNTTTQTSKIHLGINWDSRDSITAPTRGLFIQGLGTVASSSEKQSWQLLEIDCRSYFQDILGGLLATQYYLGLMSSTSIPFDQYLELGGPSRLRGFYEGRLRGRASMLIQVEHRKELSEKWTSSTFFNIGHIQLNTDKLGQGGFFPSAGAGIHYFLDKESATKGRLDAALSEEGLSLYLVMDDSF